MNLDGCVAVVTGGSSGIGQHTALGLARRGATVVITGRDSTRLRNAEGWIKARAPMARIESELVDFAQLDQVRNAGQRIVKRHPRIGILINNAGMITTRRCVTEDGFEMIFQVNHLAPFLLTNLLLPTLKAGVPSRIVFVASRAADRATIDFDDLQLEHGWGSMKAYGRSKQANIMTTYMLAKRLEGTGVTANCLHPGFVASRIGNKGGFYDIAWALLKSLAISPEEGATTSLYVAAAPEMAGITGQFLIANKPARSNAQSYDLAACERLWKDSAKMTGVDT
ncbi:SDR family NAD(P)-dependent oxidoreductase [Paraburkholderia mimosarum]|nr:SDR family NAD(P)-dependent oxidoreductase [Paraburkholderia mimosarum]